MLVKHRNMRIASSWLWSAVIAILPVVLPTDGFGFQDGNITAPATVAGYQTADLYAKVGGYITKMHVDIGDKVEKDQLLAELHAPELNMQLLRKLKTVSLAQAETEQAKAKVAESEARLKGYKALVTEAESGRAEQMANLEFNKRDRDRIAGLVARGAIQQEMLDAAQFKLEVAKSELLSSNARIATAKANLTGAEAEVVRSKADVKAAVAKIEVAEADARYAQELVNYTKIKAPFSGEISRRMFDEGAFVQNAEGNSAAKPILQIVRSDKVRVRFSLSSSNIGNLKLGDKVVLSKIDALPDKSFEGQVSRFSAALDSSTRMMSVEVDLDNKEGMLRPGYFGYVELFQSNPKL